MGTINVKNRAFCVRGGFIIIKGYVLQFPGRTQWRFSIEHFTYTRRTSSEPFVPEIYSLQFCEAELNEFIFQLALFDC